MEKGKNSLLTPYDHANMPRLNEREITGGASNEELKAAISKLIETGVLSAEQMEGALEQVRDETGRKINEASETGVSVEQEKLLKELKRQYQKLCKELLEGIPAWEQISRGLTPKELESALKLRTPTLALDPPSRRRFADGKEGGERRKEWMIYLLDGSGDDEANPEIAERSAIILPL